MFGVPKREPRLNSVVSLQQLLAKQQAAARELEVHMERHFLQEQILLLERTQVAESLKCLLSCKVVEQQDNDMLDANLGRPKKKLKTSSGRKFSPIVAAIATISSVTEASVAVDQENPDLQRVGLR